MSFRIQPTALLARSTEETQDKLLGYPLRGTRINGGIHGAMPDTWDGTGPVPPGWSSYRNSSRQHPTLAQWATYLDPDAQNAMNNGRRNNLTALEQAQMAADLAAAVLSLSPDWFPTATGAQAVKADAGRT